MAITVQHKNLSKQIILDTFRDKLRAGASDSNYYLDDPKSSSRPSDSQFITSNYPTRKVYYPLVVLSELNDSGEALDSRHSFYRHDYSVRVEIYASSNTNIYKIRDGVREYLLKNRNAIFAQGGFQDLKVQSSTAATWEEDVKIKKWELVVNGKVYTYD